MALDIFEQLIFGNGAWITLVIIAILCLVGIAIFKYFGIVSFVIFFLLGYKYFDLYKAGNNDLMWFWVLSWILAVFQIFFMFVRRKS